MTDSTKQKKLRIYKFAAEYNLSTDSLVEFLKSKDYKVKSHASLLTDEMIDEIRIHFKKDIEKSEHHYRKISEFQKSIGGKKDEEEIVQPPAEVEVVPPTEEEDKELEKPDDLVEEVIDQPE
ncbi:MAG: translation initiation factor IF-2 N-terminal domain-containing protein, partial [Ignavibacteriae bacterium]|nr:translation initiation factor IF-2 N-terminal domain-containing protein [Ignavibacteriota bacterium]